MVSCESYGKPACTSLPVIVAGEADVAVSENDVNALVDCLQRAEVRLDTENFVKESGLEREHGDHSEAVLCNSLGERFDELVVEPLSNLDISSQTSRSGKGSSGNDCYLVNGIRTLKDDDGNLTDRCHSAMKGLIGDVTDASTASAERNYEQIYGRSDLSTGCVDGAIDQGNVSVIECVLNRIPFDEIQCKGEIDGPKHDGPATIMLDKSTPEIAVAALKVDHTVKSFNREANDGNSSARIDNDLNDLNCLESPLSLRRSSRSRKTVVQTVQRGTNGIQVSKKASKLTVSRTIDLLPQATRKKRSFLSRSICSSGWGLSGRFSNYFELSKDVSDKQVLDEGKPEIKAGQRSRKRSTVKVVASSQLAEEKQALPCRPIRLKVTFGKKDEQKAIVGFLPGIEDHTSVPISTTENTTGNKIDDPVPEETTSFVKCSSSTSKVQSTGTNLDMCSTSGKSSLCDSLKLSKPENLGNSCTGKLLDPGTSPDSEVIDSSVGQNLLLNNSEKNMSSSFSIPLSLRCPASSKSSKNRRNKKDNLFGVDNAGTECQHISQKAVVLKKDDMWQKNNDNFCTDGINVPSENPSSNTTGSGSELVSMELLSVTDEGFQKAPSLDNGADSDLSRRMIGIESVDSGNSPHLCTPPETQRNRNSKGSKTKGKLKNQPKITNAKRNQKEPSGQKKSNKKLSSKREVSETIMDEANEDRGQPVSDSCFWELKDLTLVAGNFELVAVKNSDSSTRLAPQNLSCLDLPPNAVGEQTLPPRVAWVCCDECEKWRCIPAKLADVIEETNGKW